MKYLPLSCAAVILLAYSFIYVKLKAEDDYPESLNKAWSTLAKEYNRVMHEEDKVVGMSLSESMEMGPTMSHRRASWYYGRANFFLGKYSVDPGPGREKAILDVINEFLSKSTNTVKKP